MAITNITSSKHFDTVLSSSNYVVVDFFATWCGPCKAIAPVFEQLARAESKPGKMAFVKVDVDSQQDVARKYGVSAMPTFLILKSGGVVDTIRGANPGSLRSAVSKASSDAAKGPARSSAAFQSKGQVLGTGSGSAPNRATGSGLSIPSFSSGVTGGSMDTITRFIGLYLTSLFSFEGYAAAQASPYNINNKTR